MDTLFLLCACAGGTLIACQFLLGLFGLSDHHGDLADHDAPDVDHEVDHGLDQDHGDHDHGAHWYFSMLSLRALAAAFAFFGLAGMASLSAGQEPGVALLIALASGGAALVGVAYLLDALRRLRSDGTARITRAVGKIGTVYLRVPGRRGGAGKVHLNVQNRTVEYLAMTDADELPTGSRVSVVAVVSPDTVEVIAAADTKENHSNA